MKNEALEPVRKFIAVVDTLFGEEGCPWVKELNLELLQRTLLEEAHEVIASVAAKDWDELSDELGDLLFNVLCISKVLEREGLSSWQEPFIRAAQKYTRRNPHVFLPGRKLQTRKEVEIQWLEIKNEEKKRKKNTENELAKALKIFPATTLIEKVFDIIGHDEKKRKVLDAYLNMPASSEEEQIARNLLKIALQAYQKDFSIESVIKKELGSLISRLDVK